MTRRHRPYFWAIGALLALALVTGLAFYRPFQSAALAVVGSEGAKPPAPLPGKRTTFLVMGVDQRPDDFGRSDSMMLVSFDETRGQLSALSLPRDTYVDIPGHGYDKLNHAYAFGGDALARVTVERYLGIPIDHTITVTFQGFAKIVDALGGIEVDAEKALHYVDPYDTGMGPDGLVIDIQPGMQHMDGMTALKYSRFRMDDEGDIGRMRRQQQVLKAAVQAANTPAVLGKLPKLVQALQDAVDTDLSLADMLKLAGSAKDALKNPLQTASLSGAEKTIGGVFYLIPDVVAERTKAYQVVVGEAPPPEFLAAARDAQASLEKAVAEAEAEDGSGDSAGAGAPADGQGDQSGSPAQGDPAGTANAGTAKTGTGQTATSGSTGTTGSGTTTPKTPTTKTQPVTIAVVDGSGKDLLASYVKKFKAAGFRVARVGRLVKPLSQTVVIDHTGRSATVERVEAVLPGVLVMEKVDVNAGEAVEIMLGADLAK